MIEAEDRARQSAGVNGASAWTHPGTRPAREADAAAGGPPAGDTPSDAAGVPETDTHREARGGLALLRRGLQELGAGAVGSVGFERVSDLLPSPLHRAIDRRPLAALAIVVVLVLGTCGALARVALGLLAGAPKVVVAVAGPAQILDQPGGVGTLEPAPQNVFSVSLNAVGISAPIAVEKVDVVPGTHVRVGAPLITLNPVPFEQDVEQVRLALDEAESTLLSNEEASFEAAASPGSYASVAFATNIPELKGQVAIDRQLLRIAEGNTSAITAPMSGIVSSLAVTPGDVVPSGGVLLQIVNPSLVETSATVQLADLQAIKVGDAAMITPSELPGVTLRGSVVAVLPSATGGGLLGSVLVRAANDVSSPVPVGSQVYVSVDASRRSSVTLPNLAILDAQLNPTVLVIRGGRVYPAAVRLGVSDSERTAIISGVTAGERVAISDMQTLRTGEQVRVVQVQR